MEAPIYTIREEELVKSLATNVVRGLTRAEAEQRIHSSGQNTFPQKKPRSILSIFTSQFLSLFILLLVGATAVSFYLGETINSIVILLAIIVNALSGFFQEYNAQKTIIGLRQLISLRAGVLRDGVEQEIPSEQVVVGDIIILHEGDRIAADARLISALGLVTNESPLTGESQGVQKSSGTLREQKAVTEQSNMVFAGTTVMSGKGRAIVVRTAAATELGRIAALLKSTRDAATPLEKRLAGLSRTISIIVLILIVVIFLAGYIAGEELHVLFETSVATAVAAIPEGLLVTLTVALAIGMKRLARQKAVISKSKVTEALGGTTVIATDKTGTITEGLMRVVRFTHFGKDHRMHHDLEHPNLKEALRVCLLCNDAEVGYIDGRETFLGDPTETALLSFAKEYELIKPDLVSEEPRIDELPFDYTKKFMLTVHRKPGHKAAMAYMKGAPEVVLGFATHILLDGEVAPLDEAMRKNILQKISDLAGEGLRNLAFAKRVLVEETLEDRNRWTEKMIFIGMVSLKDPVRLYVQDSIKKLQRAGIKLYMISGDHALTVQAIAKEIGLTTAGVLAGEQLHALSDGELTKQIEKIRAFARVTPEDKVRIIRALQANGEIVAMTGDGVNDAPALKAADVGIAVGNGTELAKETAEIVLLDNNLATIAAAVKEGRVIFDNISKVLAFLVSTNLGEVFIILLSIILGLPLPLFPTQILWINLISDGTPNIALAMEHGEPDVMLRTPRKPSEPLITRSGILRILYVSAIFVLVVLGMFVISLRTHDTTYARTMAFTTLALFGIGAAVSFRSINHPIWQTSFWSNRLIAWSCIISIVLQIAVVYLPPLQKIFDTTALAATDWLTIAVVTIAGVFLLELRKLLFRFTPKFVH